MAEENDFAGYMPYREGEQPPLVSSRYGNPARAPSRPLFAAPRTLGELSGPVFSQNDCAGERDGSRA